MCVSLFIPSPRREGFYTSKWRLYLSFGRLLDSNSYSFLQKKIWKGWNQSCSLIMHFFSPDFSIYPICLPLLVYQSIVYGCRPKCYNLLAKNVLGDETKLNNLFYIFIELLKFSLIFILASYYQKPHFTPLLPLQCTTMHLMLLDKLCWTDIEIVPLWYFYIRA